MLITAATWEDGLVGDRKKLITSPRRLSQKIPRYAIIQMITRCVFSWWENTKL
jgi:hypothetical protein